jgi:thioredoxin 1
MLNSLTTGRVTMPYNAEFAAEEPTRAAVNALHGTLLVEFGTPWCPHCQAAQTPLAKVLAKQTDVEHLKIEDGKGRLLGRSFHVKLWPTFVLMRDGAELARVVRPTSTGDIESLFRATQPAGLPAN